MQHYTNRLRWAVLPVALRVVGVVTLCVAALSFLAFHSTPRANATDLPRMITGTISSSPYSGPAGTTISVSGSGWGGTNGTPVSFGYQVYNSCQVVSDSQDGTLNNGGFSGWFRWPSGTALNTFRVCAMLGNVMEVAGSFTVLSSNPAAVSISPTALAPNTQATITASNYYPAGTQVSFLWMSGNTVVENLGSSASNTSGIATLTFSVPKLSIGSGSYSIDASAGGGQPALFSSTNFTYTAPGVSPSPTPQPSPSPSPTMTPSPTTTPTVTPTATASVTATGASPTAGASPTLGNNQTPTTNSTNAGNSGGNNTGTPASGSSNSVLLVGGAAILFGALLAGIVILLLLSRRRKASRTGAKAMPSGLSGNPTPAFHPAYPPYHPVSGPGMFAPQPGNMPVMPLTPAPVPVGAGAFAGNGNAVAPAVNPGMMLSMPAPAQPPAWLTNPSSNGSAPAGAGSAPPTVSIPADPALDVIRRQAQSGLFVSPRPFKDESIFE